MLPAPCYVFSDAHLGVASEETERDLLAFLRGLPDDARSVVINGDLFDFWFEWRHVVRAWWTMGFRCSGWPATTTAGAATC